MPQLPDLNDMRYFAEVVERGSFAAAARALGMPTSSLSRRVAALEAALGLRLLQRSTRRLALTEVGAAYLRHCQDLRAAALAAADTVAQVQTTPRGTVRVSCPVTLAQTMLGELMPDFLARYPEVRVEMQVSNRVVNLIEEGMDVALRVRPTLDDSGSMVVKRLDDAHQVLVASPALLVRQGMPETLEALAQLDSIAMSAVDGRCTLRLIGPLGREHSLHYAPRYVVMICSRSNWPRSRAWACAGCPTIYAPTKCAPAAGAFATRVGAAAGHRARRVSLAPRLAAGGALFSGLPRRDPAGAQPAGMTRNFGIG